jgi:Creatinase/Prolidase N-terminal domain
MPRGRGVLVGTMGLEDDARVDFARLRTQRRAKVLSGMERHDLVALILGGVGDVRYASGARQLGRSGVLPFAPVAVVVRKIARVHLLSTWDEGVPQEIGYEDLYGMSWNPANLMAALATTPRLRESRRVGTDGLTPMFAGLISQLVTTAEVVDAAAVMAAARRIKTPDEITCLDVASAIAEAALSALEDALVPGITERQPSVSITSGWPALERRIRRRKVSASPRPGAVRWGTATWHPTARSGMANWWYSRRERCTPDTRPAWRAPGWPGAPLRRGRRIWRRDASAAWTH